MHYDSDQLVSGTDRFVAAAKSQPPFVDLNLDHLPGHLTAPSFSGRMKCSACGRKRSKSALGSLVPEQFRPWTGVCRLYPNSDRRRCNAANAATCHSRHSLRRKNKGSFLHRDEPLHGSHLTAEEPPQHQKWTCTVNPSRTLVFSIVPRQPSNQFYEALNDRRWFISAGSEVQRRFWSMRTSLTAIDNSLYIHALDRRRNEEYAEACSGKAECGGKARGFQAEARTKACRPAGHNRRGKQSETIPSSVNNEHLFGQCTERHRSSQENDCRARPR